MRPLVWSEILKIKPQLDQSDLNKMDRTLSSRFANVSKKFGKGLGAILGAGGIAGAAVGATIALVDKILNPLKEVQEAIDRTLNAGDNIVTNAKEFNTTPGRLLNLQSFAGAKGLDPEGLDTLLVKFQGAVADAVGDPNKPSAVRQFTGEKDTAEAFFQFIQSLQVLRKTDPNAAIRAQAEVFGERQRLKSSEFLNADFAELSRQLQLPNEAQMTQRLNKLDDTEDFKSLLAQRTRIFDLSTKNIGKDIVTKNANADLRRITRENSNIAQFDSLKTVDDATIAMSTQLEKVAVLLGKLLSIGIKFTGNIPTRGLGKGEGE
jgi:hypothetical protein